MCVNENVCCALPHIFPTRPSVLAFLHFAFKQQKWQQQQGEVAQLRRQRFSRTNAKFLAINFIPGLPSEMFSSLQPVFPRFFGLLFGSICFVMVLIKF